MHSLLSKKESLFNVKTVMKMRRLKLFSCFFAEVKMLAAPTTSGSSSSKREKTSGGGLSGGSVSGSAAAAKEADANNDDLPLAIQTFLWRQTRFVKMHLSPLTGTKK